MPENTYQSINTEQNSEDKVKIYSPTQVACGTIGGPVGLVYFLSTNFSALENEYMKQKTLILGGIFILALIAILPFLPEEIPSTPFTILYIVIARVVSDRFQMSKIQIVESNQFEFQSNWRVLFIGLLCFVISLIVVLVPLILLDLYGIIKL